VHVYVVDGRSHTDQQQAVPRPLRAADSNSRVLQLAEQVVTYALHVGGNRGGVGMQDADGDGKLGPEQVGMREQAAESTYHRRVRLTTGKTSVSNMLPIYVASNATPS
jgi:hypothetical protein